MKMVVVFGIIVLIVIVIVIVLVLVIELIVMILCLYYVIVIVINIFKSYNIFFCYKINTLIFLLFLNNYVVDLKKIGKLPTKITLGKIPVC